MSGEAGNVEGDDLDRDGDSLGAREVVGGRLRSSGPVVPGDLAGGAAPFLRRARVMVRDRRQAEECEECDENDDRLARTEQAFERPTRKGASRHGRRA